MTKTSAMRVAAATFLAASALLSARPAAAALNVYLSKPGDVASTFDSITTETFENTTTWATGNHSSNVTSAIGTYDLSNTSKLDVIADDQYGSGSRYVSLGAQSSTSGPVTIQFNSPQAYFGFEWQAGDANNGLTFYNGNQLLGRFSTASILTLLSGSTVTAVDGSSYATSSYKGHPGTGTNAGKDSNEPFSFVNIIDTTGLFDRVVFDNSSTTATGFETDNHTIRAAAPTPLGSFVTVGTVQIPEPSVLALLSTGLVGTFLVRRRKA